jgi:hypothetical protein
VLYKIYLFSAVDLSDEVFHFSRLNRKNTLVEAKRARMKVGWKTNNGKDVLPGKMKDMNHVRRRTSCRLFDVEDFWRR